MPKSALPPHMQGSIDEVWGGTDNSSWLMKLKKRIQYVFLAGPRVPSGFFKFREIPKLVFLKSSGETRWENTDGSYIENCYRGYELIDTSWLMYLSRIQPWCRWHISLQWPLFLNFHVIYRKRDVVEYPKYKSDFGITKMFTFSIGYKRDGDKVYWPTTFIGGNFE